MRGGAFGTAPEHVLHRLIRLGSDKLTLYTISLNLGQFFTERLDLLVADGLAYQTALVALAKRLTPEERKAALRECREVIDALIANPKTTDRGHATFQKTDETLRTIFE